MRALQRILDSAAFKLSNIIIDIILIIMLYLNLVCNR
jgi:hypothetical protein